MYWASDILINIDTIRPMKLMQDGSFFVLGKRGIGTMSDWNLESESRTFLRRYLLTCTRIDFGACECGGGGIDDRESRIAVSPPVRRCTILSSPSPRAKSAIRACTNNRQRIPGRIGTPATVQTTTRGTSLRYSGASPWTRPFQSRRRNRTVGGCSIARKRGILTLSSILHLAICVGSPRAPSQIDCIELASPSL